VIVRGHIEGLFGHTVSQELIVSEERSPHRRACHSVNDHQYDGPGNMDAET
jgi:hypothetical protein